MDLQHLPHLTNTARQIHQAIRNMAVFSPPPIEFISEAGEASTIRIMRQRFRKPFMTQAHTWVQRLLVNDFQAYAFMSQYIELRIRHQHWTSWGMLVHPLDQLNPEVAKVLLGNIGPCYLRIDLGQLTAPFQGLLENLKPTKHSPISKRGVA